MDRDYIYDLEVYPNFFSAAFEHAATGQTWYFELSQERNDINALVVYIYQLKAIHARLVGYNNINFDYVFIHMLCKRNYDVFCSPLELNRLLYDLCEILINGSKDQKWACSVWASDWIVEQVDLYKIHHFDNMARSTSLKILQFNMRSQSVEDLPFPPGTWLPREALPVIRHYNKHDVSETKLFYFESLAAIKMREELTEKYGRNFINHNDTKIGKDYFIMKLEEQNPNACYYRDQNNKKTPHQTARPVINLASVIFQYITFEQPEFNGVMEYLKSQTITETKGVFIKIKCTLQQALDANHSTVNVSGVNSVYLKGVKTDNRFSADHNMRIKKVMTAATTGRLGRNIKLHDLLAVSPDYPLDTCQFVMDNLNCVVNGLDYVFGVGGLHASVDPQTVTSNDEYMIIDVDVASYYPNIAIANRLYPEHLSEKFCDIYIDVYNQRKATPKGSPENAMLKLALNGVYGDSNNKFSPFYDPAYTMAITINGQLLLCMLAEQLIKINGLQIIQANTDGITVRLPRNNEQYVNNVCQWWESFTCLTLESVEYNRMFIRDVNNYIGEYTDGSLKRKGDYCVETPRENPNTRELGWHKDHSAIVVAKAAEAVLVRGEDLHTFIHNHFDILDFMLRTKVPRSSRLVGVIPDPLDNDATIDTPLSNITRYYVTRQGVELVKIMPPLAKNPDLYRRIRIDAGWKVSPCNNLNDIKEPINYDYYIDKANKLIEKLL